MASTEEMREQRRVQILEAALAVFTENGIDHARMEDIAHEAGLSKGTLYLYFESKEALLFAMLEYLFDEYFQTAQEVMPEDEGSVAQRLYGLADAFVSYSQEFSDIWPLSYEIYAWALREKAVRERVREYFDVSQEMVSAMIREGIERGEFRPVDPEETALQIIALNEGLQQLQALHDESVDWRAIMRRMIDFIVEALKPSEIE